MRKMTEYNVQIIGLAIYIVSLSFSIYYITLKTIEVSREGTDIVSVLLLDKDSDDQNDESKPIKKLGSRFVSEEDDDDSAKDFNFEQFLGPQIFGHSATKSVIGYASNPRDINTPPPKC